MDKTTRMLRNKDSAVKATEYGIQNRNPRNGEYAGLHSNSRTQKALELAQKHDQRVPCGYQHYVYPSGLISRRNKIVRSK